MKKNQTALPEATAGAQQEVTDKKPGKLFIIISYALALASLIAMLFVPLYYEDMLIKHLLAAVAPILDLCGVSIPLTAYGEFFVPPLYDLANGILITLIFLSVVIALIMLIPVIAGKAQKGTNLRCAFAAELIAFIFILASVCNELRLLDSTTWYDYSLLIPLGVIMLVMAAQSIKYKGGLGVAKFIIFLLSLLTLFTLFDIVAFIPALEEPLLNLAGAIKAYDAEATFLGTCKSALTPLIMLCENEFVFVGTEVISAFIHQIISLVLAIVLVLSILTDIISLVTGKKTKKNGEPNPQTGRFVRATIRYSFIIILLAAVITLSFVLEGFGKVGIYMYLTAVLVLLAFIVEIVRFCVAKSKVKAYRREQENLFKNEKLIIKDETLAEEEVAEVAETAEVVEASETVNEQTNMFGDEATVEAQPAEISTFEEPTESVGQQLSIMDAQSVEEEVTAQPVEEVAEPEQVTAEPVEEVVPVVPVVPVVEETVDQSEPVAEEAGFNLFGEEEKQENDSIDPFIDKLTDEERAQFYDVFINRNQGKFSSIPVYQINGDNSDFFPSVFVHINRMRNLCSDSLLAKIYKEICNN